MRITRNGDRTVFHLGKRERHLFEAVLDLYPVLPPAYHEPSRSSVLPNVEETRHLLNDSLAERRAEHRRHLETLFHDPARFQITSGGADLSLAPDEVEHLLQVLNDIRVGNWVLLGSPDEAEPPGDIGPESAQYLWAMEIAGYFLMQILEGFETPETEPQDNTGEAS